jgi:hypothetical protein
MKSVAVFSDTMSRPDEIDCPRCGYDLRGTVATWRDQCPLEGTCTECGLRFAWSHVLMIGKYEPAWCVEFAPAVRNVPRACASTFLRSFRPWRFWRSMNMSSRVRWRRLAVYLLFLLCLASLLYVAAQTTRAIIVRSAHDQWLSERLQMLPTQIAQKEAQLRAAKDGVFPLSTSNMPKDEQIAQMEYRLDEMKASLATPPVIDHSYIAAVIEAVFNPFGTTSLGSVRAHDGRLWPYPSPSEYQEFLINHSLASGNSPRGLWTRAPSFGWADTRSVMIDFGVSVSLALLLPTSFILLPASRRRAKVRWRHIGRVAMYSLAFPAFVLTVLIAAVGLMSIPQTVGWVPDATWKLPTLLWLLLPLWWWAAIKRYLRMPHALAVAFLMTLMIALLFAPMWISDMPRWLDRLLL